MSYFRISNGNDFTEIITTCFCFVILILFEHIIDNTSIKMYAKNP